MPRLRCIARERSHAINVHACSCRCSDFKRSACRSGRGRPRLDPPASSAAMCAWSLVTDTDVRRLPACAAPSSHAGGLLRATRPAAAPPLPPGAYFICESSARSQLTAAHVHPPCPLSCASPALPLTSLHRPRSAALALTPQPLEPFTPTLATPALHAFWKPMSLAYSRKHWRQMFMPYLRMRPHLLAHTRLRGGAAQRARL